MIENTPNPPVLLVADLPAHKPTRFGLIPDKPARARIAQQLGISQIRKLTFRGSLQADGKSDWRLEARLGATVVQPCVVTLDPVTTRIDQSVVHRFIAGLSMAEAEAGDDVEMPGDETLEVLPTEIDLIRIMTQALALALPDYPRRGDAALKTTGFSAPGITPMSDEDARPFAGLAGLKEKLIKPG